MTDPLFQIHNLSGGYGPVPVVRDFSLDVRRGEFLGLLGPNGSGKSTLLRLMTRVLTPFRGDLSFEGKPLREWSLREFCRRAAFVPQDAPSAFSFTVREMVLMGRIPHMGRMAFASRRDRDVAEEALGLAGLLPHQDKRLDELSAGERQRVLLSRALAQEPIVLLGDEPTSHLDIGHQAHLLDLLKKLNRDRGMTVVMVLHDLNLAAHYCDRVVLVKEGRAVRAGAPEDALVRDVIESVYETPVLVDRNPATGRPRVSLAPGSPRNN